MAKKSGGGSDSAYEEEEEQRLKLHGKSKSSSSASKPVATSQKKADTPRGYESEAESEYDEEEEEEESSEEEEETSPDGKQDASRETPKSATAEGSPGSESESDSEEVQKPSSKGKEENRDASKEAPKSANAEEPESEDELRRKLRTKKKKTKKMIIPLLDTPKEDEEGSDEDEEESQTEPKSNGGNKIVSTKKLSTKRRAADNIEIDSRVTKRATALNPFARKWTQNDKVLLLEEMLKYKSKSNNIIVDMNALAKFIEENVQFDFDPTIKQLYEKMRKLRWNYNKKKTGKVDPSAMKPHDLLVFELSRKYWGDSGNLIASEARKNQEAAKFLDPKPVLPYYPQPGCCIGGGLGSADNEALKEGFELIREPLPWESGKRWTEIRIRACEQFAEKVDLIQNQNKLTGERLNLMKEAVTETCDKLKASLSNQNDEED